MLQAAIDDSVDAESGIYVLAGYIADVQTWAKFSRDWERMLPHATRNERGEHKGEFQFHMRDMAQNEERQKRVAYFLRIIEEYELTAVIAKINRHELADVISSIYLPHAYLDFEQLDRPFVLAFRFLLEKFHTSRAAFADIIPENEPIDFVFDNHSDKKIINEMWDEYKANRGPLKSLFGANPIFQDDFDYKPLQAADFIAWWARRWFVNIGIMPDPPQFEWISPQKNHVRIVMELDRKDMLDQFSKWIRQTGYTGPIYDLNFGSTFREELS